MFIYFVYLFFPSVVIGLHYLPEHARHGKLETLLHESRNNALVVQHVMKQRLDHFSNSSTTFNQRYYVDDTYWGNASSPILLYIGGEGALNTMPGGFMDVLAAQLGAKLIALEHRFYGQSIPFNDLSTNNLQHLTVEQALADLDFFQAMYTKKATLVHNDWICVGGSYPGALSAWYRIAYPNNTIAALASSAVVHSIYDYTAFDTQVSTAIGPACAAAVQHLTRKMEATNVKALFGASHLSDADFFYMAADAAAMTVQYGHKDKLCIPLLAAVDVVDTFATFVNTYYGKEFGSSCFYDTHCLQNEPDRWSEGLRAWRWQKCTQVAFFQVAPTTNSLRSSLITLKYHEEQCTSIFGKVNPSLGSLNINLKYGGAHPSGHRILFTNFQDDPWQTASILTSPSSDQPALLARCDLCGHCADLGNNSIPALIAQRHQVQYYLQRWLSSSKLPSTTMSSSFPNLFLMVLVLGLLLSGLYYSYHLVSGLVSIS